MALCVGSIKTHSNTFNKQLLLTVSYLTLDPQIFNFLGVQVLKGFSFCHVRPASHDDLHMIRIQLRFFPNNLPFNLSGVIPCSRPCIECLSIFLPPFFGLLIQHHSVFLSVPSTAFSASFFVFQTPFLVQHGLPFFIFRFGIPFSLAFLSFFFLLLAQVLPQFTARYGHDELMSLCNNLFESPVLSMGFRRIIIIIIYSIHRALIPNGPKALEMMVQYLAIQKKQR